MCMSSIGYTPRKFTVRIAETDFGNMPSNGRVYNRTEFLRGRRIFDSPYMYWIAETERMRLSEWKFDFNPQEKRRSVPEQLALQLLEPLRKLRVEERESLLRMLKSRQCGMTETYMKLSLREVAEKHLKKSNIRNFIYEFKEQAVQGHPS